MEDETGTKRVVVVDPSPMPVLLTNPTPDPRFNGKDTVRVVPGLIRLGSRPYRLKEVVWINETGGEVTFRFDAAGSAKFFDFGGKDPRSITVANKQELRLKLAKQPPENSIYSYEVDCAVTSSQAQGNSPPEVTCP
jgi:hypothetical protein